MSTRTTEPTRTPVNATPVNATAGYAPLVSKTGGQQWKEVRYAGDSDPDVQLDAAYYLARARRDQRIDLDAARDLFEILGLDRDTVITERIRVAEQVTR